jgi:ABC-2 type transport system permease protein
MIFNMQAYGRLTRLEATSPISGGVLYFLGGYFVRFARTLLLLSIWRTIFSTAGNPEELDAVLRYTMMAAIFWQQVDVTTTASTTYWEGNAASRFLRPLNIFGQYIAETVGKWIPGLLLSGLPLLLLTPVLGVDLRPANPTTLLAFIVSLVLGMACGFAMDFILAGFMVFLGNAHYIAHQIRAAFVILLSGALIPLHLLPFGIGEVFKWLPFATMASTLLSIYAGTAGNAAQLILLQLGWAVILWVLASLIWRKNRQKLVVFGG